MWIAGVKADHVTMMPIWSLKFVCFIKSYVFKNFSIMSALRWVIQDHMVLWFLHCQNDLKFIFPSFTGNNGLTYIIQVISKLLDPKTSEYTASFVGRLVAVVLTKAGSQLGEQMDLMLRAVLSKMQQTETLSVMQVHFGVCLICGYFVVLMLDLFLVKTWKLNNLLNSLMKIYIHHYWKNCTIYCALFNHTSSVLPPYSQTRWIAWGF